MPGAGHDLTQILTGSGNVEAIDVDSDGLVDILEGQYFTISGSGPGAVLNITVILASAFMMPPLSFSNQKTNRNF